ncbi:MAG: hypothetical protein MJZ29_07395 [Bacteroidaceae bacterium]|nr:hypothetical protein [Bacteroidaceae bacterium]
MGLHHIKTSAPSASSAREHPIHAEGISFLADEADGADGLYIFADRRTVPTIPADAAKAMKSVDYSGKAVSVNM